MHRQRKHDGTSDSWIAQRWNVPVNGSIHNWTDLGDFNLGYDWGGYCRLQDPKRPVIGVAAVDLHKDLVFAERKQSKVVKMKKRRQTCSAISIFIVGKLWCVSIFVREIRQRYRCDEHIYIRSEAH